MTTETSTNNNKYRICFSQNRCGHLFPAFFPLSLETASESFSMMTTMMLFALAHEKKPICSLCCRSHFRSQSNSPHLHPPRELNLCSDFKRGFLRGSNYLWAGSEGSTEPQDKWPSPPAFTGCVLAELRTWMAYDFQTQLILSLLSTATIIADNIKTGFLKVPLTSGHLSDLIWSFVISGRHCDFILYIQKWKR